MGREHPVLLGKIGIHVRLAQKESCYFRIWSCAAMYQHKICLTQRSIIDYRIEQGWIRTAYLKITSAPCTRVNVYRQPQFPGPPRDFAKQHVMQVQIVSLLGNATPEELRVGEVGCFAVWFPKIQRSQIRGFELYRHRSGLFLPLQGGSDHLVNIMIEYGWNTLEV